MMYWNSTTVYLLDTLFPISSLQKELHQFFQLQPMKQHFQRRSEPPLNWDNKNIHLELFAHNKQSIGAMDRKISTN